MPTLAQWRDRARASLSGVGIDQAEADAAWIACHVLGVGRGELEAKTLTDSSPLSRDDSQQLDTLLSRRLARQPLWHIIGTAPFLGMDLAVGQGVFTPRPETELLAHLAVGELLSMDASAGDVTVWDVGAGSGAIGLAIVQAIAHARVWSAEPSEKARVFLANNVERLGDGRVTVVPAPVAQIQSLVDPGSVDAVVSNPPYLIRGVDHLDPETRLGDPDDALFAEGDGLDVLVEVIDFARWALRPAGVILVEHGIGHNEPVAAALIERGFTLVSHQADLVGRPRFTRATKASA
jgi:release factor glutamine methyltransferase